MHTPHLAAAALLFGVVSSPARAQTFLSFPANSPEPSFGGTSADGGTEPESEFKLVPLQAEADLSLAAIGLAANQTRASVQPSFKAMGQGSYWYNRRFNLHGQLVAAGNPTPSAGTPSQVADQIRLNGGTFALEAGGLVGYRFNDPDDRGTVAIQLRGGIQGALQLADLIVLSDDGGPTTRLSGFGILRLRAQLSLWLYWVFVSIEVARFTTTLVEPSELRGQTNRPLWTINIGVPLLQEKTLSDGAKQSNISYVQFGLSGDSFANIFNAVTISIGTTFAPL